MRRPARVPYLAGIARMAGGASLRPPRPLFGDEAYTPVHGAGAEAGRRSPRPAGPQALAPLGDPAGEVAAPGDSEIAAPHAAPAAGRLPAPEDTAAPSLPAAAGAYPGEPAATRRREGPVEVTPPSSRPAGGEAPAVPAHAAPAVPAPAPAAGTPVTSWFDPRWSEPVVLPPGAAAAPPERGRDRPPSGWPSTQLHTPAPGGAGELGDTAAVATQPGAARAAGSEDLAPPAPLPPGRPAAAAEILLRPVLAAPAAGEPAAPAAGGQPPVAGSGGRVFIGAIDVTVVPPPAEAPRPAPPPPAPRLRPPSLIAGGPGIDRLRNGRRWYGTAQS